MFEKSGCIIISLLFLTFNTFAYNENSKDPGCDKSKKAWTIRPEIEEHEYVHSSLAPFREWFASYLNKKNNRSKLNMEQCFAASFFLRIYAWSGEPCEKRSLAELYSWINDCSKKWLDPEYIRYDGGCYIYDVPTLTDQSAAYVITQYLINNPECRINTPEELRFKINKQVIEAAKKILANPSITKNSTTADCNEIINPNIWRQLVILPKSYSKIKGVKQLAAEALQKARELFPAYKKNNKTCSSLLNGRGDAFRHCYWTCMITKKYNASMARNYSDFHEVDSKNKCNEAIMDHKNNEIGILYGMSNKNCQESCFNSKELNIVEEEICF